MTAPESVSEPTIEGPPASTELPKGQLTVEEAAQPVIRVAGPPGDVRRRRTPATIPCPECGVPLYPTSVSRHMRRAHARGPASPGPATSGPASPASPATPSWAGDPRFIQKGGDCFVCQNYVEPGTPMRDLCWCPRHHFRHRACQPSAGGGSAPPYTPPGGAERRGERRRCTCTSTYTTRARARDLKVESHKSGTSVEFTVQLGDSEKEGGRVMWWLDRRQAGRPEALALIAQLGFAYEGP
jgi:hypothetical protein